MSHDTDLVMHGFVHLSQADRQAVVTRLNEYLNASAPRERVLRESIDLAVGRINVGPLGSGNCPCCGR